MRAIGSPVGSLEGAKKLVDHEASTLLAGEYEFFVAAATENGEAALGKETGHRESRCS